MLAGNNGPEAKSTKSGAAPPPISSAATVGFLDQLVCRGSVVGEMKKTSGVGTSEGLPRSDHWALPFGVLKKTLTRRLNREMALQCPKAHVVIPTHLYTDRIDRKSHIARWPHQQILAPRSHRQKMPQPQHPEKRTRSTTPGEWARATRNAPAAQPCTTLENSNGKGKHTNTVRVFYIE